MRADAELVVAATMALPAGATPTHTVAAAVRCTGGDIRTGVNLFHFTGGACAEMVALANAAGATPARIVAVGDAGRGILAPCGRCRQILIDLYPGIEVVLPDRIAPIEDLLPGAYRWRDGAR